MNTIDGVTVLNSHIENTVNIEWACVGICLYCIIFLFGIIMLCEKEYILGIFLIVLSLIMTVTTSLGLYFNKEVLHEDVLIGDSVSINDIFDKYEVKGKDGEIYHLILKEEKHDL